MSRSYAIWNKVEACIYNSDKSYGAKDVSTNEILVGSSNSNSHTLATVTTKKVILDDTIEFRLYVDGKVIKKLSFENNNNRAGKIIEL